MPLISIDCVGLSAEEAGKLAIEVREQVILALPEVAHALSCRVTQCAAAAWDGPDRRARAWAEVTMFPGRTPAQKRALFTGIVAGCRRAGLEATSVTTTIQEPDPSNWGVRGGVPAAETPGKPAAHGPAGHEPAGHEVGIA